MSAEQLQRRNNLRRDFPQSYYAVEYVAQQSGLDVERLLPCLDGNLRFASKQNRFRAYRVASQCLGYQARRALPLYFVQAVRLRFPNPPGVPYADYRFANAHNPFERNHALEANNSGLADILPPCLMPNYVDLAAEQAAPIEEQIVPNLFFDADDLLAAIGEKGSRVSQGNPNIFF